MEYIYINIGLVIWSAIYWYLNYNAAIFKSELPLQNQITQNVSFQNQKIEDISSNAIDFMSAWPADAYSRHWAKIYGLGSVEASQCQ